MHGHCILCNGVAPFSSPGLSHKKTHIFVTGLMKDMSCSVFGGFISAIASSETYN